MSDKKNNAWKPLIDQEKVKKKPEKKDADAVGFKILYEEEKNDDNDGFSLMYEVKDDSIMSDGSSEKENKPTDPEEVRKQAYDEGFSKGETDGYNAGQEKAGAEVENLRKLIFEIEGLWKKLVDTYEGQIISLITKIAEKVVYGQTSVDNEIVKRAILHAFELIPEPVDVTISVNPEDYDFVEIIREDIFAQVKDLTNISVISNPAVSRGGCMIDTKAGEVDSSIETRIKTVLDSIIEAGSYK